MGEESHKKDLANYFYSSNPFENVNEKLNYEEIRDSLRKQMEEELKTSSHICSLRITPYESDYRKLVIGEWVSEEHKPNLVETGCVTEEYIRERLLFCPKELLEKYYDLKDKLINELKYFELFLRSKNIESSCEIIYSHIIFKNKDEPVTEEELAKLLKSYSVSFEIKKEDLEELKEFLENLDVGALISSIGETSKSTFDKSFWYLKVLILISN
jgi:hypothetical protein